ncbi:hypothetical protein [Rhodopila sp.]|uniref:hypothetical protein n=1 Tax=Rhodopila sp. TaxID=2480087 RepID=UPI003D0ECDC8
MENHDLDEIDASAREIVRRAYDLGRSEALKRVVDVLSTDRPSADRLALMAPNETEPSPHETALNGAASHAGASNGAASADKPWWAWPVR